MDRARTLQGRLRLLVGGVGVVLAVLIVGLAFAVADFRDGVNRREDLIPAAGDAAELSGILVDQLTALDQPRASGQVEAAAFRTARQRAAVLVGRLQRELADRAALAAELDLLQDELLEWQAAVTSMALVTGTEPGSMAEPDLGRARALLTSLVGRADSLTSSIAKAVEDVAEDAEQSRDLFVWGVAGAGAIALCMLVAGGYALHQWVVLPVRRLSDDVSSIAEGGYALPLTASGGRELEVLADSVVRMRDRILAERDRAVRAVEAMDQEAPAVAALRTLLAPRLAEPPEGLVAAGALLPAEGVLAGDWFDIAVRDDEVVIAIGDVCGHGVAAGVLAVRTKFALLDSIDLGLEPDAALEQAARRFGRDDTFVTALVAAIDPRTGRCRYASAGHNPALVVRAEGTVEHLPRTGPLIGLAEGPRPTARTTLGAGDLLVAYTDGVVEARDDAGEQWLVERLEELLLEHRAEPPDKVAELALAQVLTHCGGRCTDDATMVVVRFGG